MSSNKIVERLAKRAAMQPIICLHIDDETGEDYEERAWVPGNAEWIAKQFEPVSQVLGAAEHIDAWLSKHGMVIDVYSVNEPSFDDFDDALGELRKALADLQETSK